MYNERSFMSALGPRFDKAKRLYLKGTYVTQQVELTTRRSVVRELLALGLTTADVAFAMDITNAAAQNDFFHLGGKNTFPISEERGQNRREKASANAFRKYAQLYQRTYDPLSDVEKTLEKALEKFLDIEYILAFVEGVAAFSEILREPKEKSEFKPYRNLLSNVFGERPRAISGLAFLEGYLGLVAGGEEHSPSRTAFPKVFATWVLNETRNAFRMRVTEYSVKLIDQVVTSLSQREEKVIRLRFGLKSGRPLTLDACTLELKVTRERIRQIEAKAMRKLRHPARGLQRFGKSPEQQAEEALAALLPPPNLADTPLPETASMPERERVARICAISLEEMGVSVRIFWCLRSRDIQTIGRLIEFTEDELLKTKDFGCKSLNEIKQDVLAPRGISLRCPACNAPHIGTPGLYPMCPKGTEEKQEVGFSFSTV